MAEGMIRLVRARPEELRDVMLAVQEAFAPAVEESFGRNDYGPVPTDEDVQASFDAPGAEVWHVVQGTERVGGAVVRIDAAGGHNVLDLFFLSPSCHGRGLGLAAWRALETMYPQTRTWETVTPYFESGTSIFT